MFPSPTGASTSPGLVVIAAADSAFGVREHLEYEWMLMYQ